MVIAQCYSCLAPVSKCPLLKLQHRILRANLRPLQRLLPDLPLLLSILTLRRTLILLQKGKVPRLPRIFLTHSQLDHILPGLRSRAHSRVKQSQQRPERLDNEAGDDPKNQRRVGAESARITQVAWIDSYSLDVL